MKNRIVSLLLILCLLGACLPGLSLPASAEGTTGSCGVNLTWSYDSSAGTLTVSGTGSMENWDTSADVPWNDLRASIRTLQLSAGMTSISNYAFFNCDKLTVAEIPDTVTSIGRCAFEQCDALTRVVIGSGLKSIGEGAFRNCKQLATVMITANSFGFDLNNSTTLGNPNLTTIYAAEGSTAALYARDYGYKLIVDVPPKAFYTTAVTWAAEKGITSGLDKTHFGPNATCTRAQVVTFLWRASGSPEPTRTDNPFTDVSSGAYYYKAVLWAVEKGITSGTSKTAFSPNAGCTRGQVVTFLWRAKGSPDPRSTDNPFTDVDSGAFYYHAVLWAVNKEITAGVSKTAFAPGRTCTRAQIVTFLYRTWSAIPDMLTYHIVYRSNHGTDLGKSSATFAYGSTNTITPPAKTGYKTPAAQSVVWDEVEKTITFTYEPTAVATSQSAASGTWWWGDAGGLTYAAHAEYQNRTATSIQIRIKWVQSIKSAYYGYNQYFKATIGNGSTGNVKIASISTWPAGDYYTASKTVYSPWVTVSVNATATSVNINANWWAESINASGSWSKKLTIPAY